MLKKPFLSLYEQNRSKSINESTRLTDTGGENADQDEFYFDATSITQIIESDNENNYILGSTLLTESTEDSDTDEFLIN